MNEKHNLDRLFQEKFKDFEVTPPEHVWENIREELQGKKKRKAIPLWLRLSGVAALLMLSGLIALLFFNDLENPATNAPPVVIDNKTTTPANAVKSSDGTTPVHVNPLATGILTESNNVDNNTAVASGEENRNTTKPKNAINTILPVLNNSKNAVAHGGDATTINKNKDKRINRTADIQQNDIVMTSEAAKQTNRINNSVNPTTKEPATDIKISVNSPERQNSLNNVTDSEGIAGADSTSDKNLAAKGYTIIDKNIPVDKTMAQTTIDSSATVIPENELEKLLQEKLNGKEENNAVAENNNDKERWNIRPQIAPLFYNSLSDGSPINEQFASNSKTYNNELSYGLGINYAINERISIRSGINTVNLNYSTNDIAYYASLNSLTSNIGQSKTGNIVIQNPGDATPEPFLINGQATQLLEGSMVQKTGYIEVPLEMSYALVNKKFGIDVIGGVSSLFLNQNNVSVVSSTGMSTQVGKAQNLNNLHFSTNVGVGFKYKFWDSFQASFEPTFKYQVNAYSRDAGNFKPYFIGLYSGVSFSF